MKKRRTKPQKKRHCIACGTELSGYKLQYCDGTCQRKAAWKREKMGGKMVSACCDAGIKRTVRGNFCRKCDKPCDLATIYAVPKTKLVNDIRKAKNSIRGRLDTRGRFTRRRARS